ncbi:hypothetical protein B0H17DRAFT_346582 [Mycena rosella]|uniref:Uncharacterized protein n=1 Tax=Mycena rosella TaxID=1033263 RepID=A0AAD7CQP0_MYCRO|nr:hypothetical protein B0H17DRAFT_346582 [Mycena rosella]
MIVPLYNLQAHNVMTNIIVDAGTDAKIARFTKRGIEMLELAVLEPVEVYPGGGAPTNGDAPLGPGAGSGFSARTVGGRPSMSGGLLVPGAPGSRSNSRPGTPDPTNASEASLTSSSAHSHSHHEVPPSPTQQSTPQKRNLFGKLFKKKDAAGGTPDSETPTPTLGHKRTLSALARRPVSPNPAAVAMALPRSSMSSTQRSSLDLGGEEAVPAAVAGVRAPVLGLLPSISSPVYPPKGRPALYVWAVKRWLKGEGGGLLAVARGMVKGQGGDGDLTAEVELRFEWKRGKPKRRREHKEKKEGEGEDEGERANRRKPSHANLATPAKRLSVSIISRQSSFSTVGASEDGHVLDAAARRASVAPMEEDSGEESDPEDSETPWTCTVKVRRLAAHQARHHHMPSFGSGAREGRDERDRAQDETDRAQWKKEVVRIKVGTLSPTPHHPKVVAMLKVPFPLPDVDVEHMVVRKREPGQGPLEAGGGRGTGW